MKRLVLDASAGLKLLHEEAGTQQAVDLVGQRLAAGVAVPPLFWLEIVNVLARRYHYPASAVLEGMRELNALGIQTVEAGAVGVVAIIDLMERHDLTAYDACYFGLAESLDADLLTADRRLGVAAGDRALLIDSAEGIAEDGADYRPRQATWPSWPDAGAYLAELRKAL